MTCNQMNIPNLILWFFHCDNRNTFTKCNGKYILALGAMHPIYTIIAAPLHFVRIPLSSIFCFFVVLGPSTLSSMVYSCTWTLITPILTMMRVNCIHNIDRGYNACESEIVSKCMCLTQNAWELAPLVCVCMCVCWKLLSNSYVWSRLFW